MADKDILAEAKEAFKDAVEAESENREAMLRDIKFGRLGEQWPDQVKLQRERAGRPCLVINRLPAFARQVANDARQNRPGISITGVDSQSDPATARVLSGLIKHIERNSCADVAYDTAIEFAIYGGIGYITIGTDYASEDSFEQEVKIERVVNPFSVYGDADAESADGSDWKYAFQTIDGEELAEKYGKKEISSWSDFGTGDIAQDDELRLVRYWKVGREKKTLVLLSNGAAVTADKLDDDFIALLAANQITPAGQEREIIVPKVAMYVLSNNGVLETVDWAGRYIPIIPVYGEEIWVENKRIWKSLIRDAKDAQSAINFWRSATTELVALQPKAPFIGPKGSFKTDAAKWATANTDNHQYMEFDPIPNQPPPQRQPFAGVPAGAMQEALNASDDIKTILGMYDASLGARSNETSGKAIMARQREGDVSTFHFVDNLTRSIRQVGKVCLDLIPKVYDTPRIVRIIGKEDQTSQVPINQEYEAQDDQGNPYVAIHDLSVGRYDVDVKAGPSFTTQRQEAAVQMTELIRAFPAAAPVIGDLLAKNLDWPGAEEISKRLEKLVPGNGQDPSQMAQMAEQLQQSQQAIEQGKQEIEIGKRELETMVADLKIQQANLKVQEANLKAQVAQANADIQGREMQLHQRGMETDARGQQMESQARQSGEQSGVAIVQQALQSVQQAMAPIAQQIAALEQKLGQQQPIVVPVPTGGGRRQVSVKRGKDGGLMGMIEDIADDGIG